MNRTRMQKRVQLENKAQLKPSVKFREEADQVQKNTLLFLAIIISILFTLGQGLIQSL